MKKVLFTCALIAAATTAFAQKANLTKAETALNASLIPAQAEKLDEAWDLIQPAMSDEVTKSMGKTWGLAGEITARKADRTFKQSTAAGALDTLGYFNRTAEMIGYYEKAYDCDRLPDAKGKTLKPEVIEKNTREYYGRAGNARRNLVVAASVTFNSHPKECLNYLDVYYATAQHPLFKDSLTEKDNSDMLFTYYVYAKANQAVGGDKAKTIEYLEKAFDSENGAAACYELMKDGKESGNEAQFIKYAKIGMQRWPNESTFSDNISSYYFTEKKWAEFDKFAEEVLASDPNNNRILRMKAQAYYEQNKSTETLETLKKIEALDPNDADIIEFIGNLSFSMAQKNASNKAKSTQLYKQSIEYYKKLEKLLPGDSKRWGYALYACYNNISDAANAAKYKKYANQ